MRRNQPKDSRFEEYDEHNQPTEPMSQVILTPYSSSSNIYGAPTNPLPEPDEQLFLPGSNAFLVPGSSNRSKVSPAYPFLPAAPAFNGNGRPPGGAYPVRPADIVQPGKRRRTQPRRSIFPALVGLLFVLIQLLLLVRVVLQLLGQPGNVWWVGLIYNVSSVFVLPLRLLLQNVSIPLIAGTDLYNYLLALVAILLYGLISRILVRFLKALLHSR
ncbi:MAG TPA: hypothetical protein VFA09_23950 [Ktedonobacteraceae bacterium]|nr:hypothetical protein [Ktedonobacteraceae bacterium]